MSLVRKLSIVYLLCALAFGVQLAFERAPAFEQASRQMVAAGLETTRAYVVTPIADLAREGTTLIVAMLSGKPAAPADKPAAHRATAATPPAVVIPKAAPVVPKAPVLTPPLPAPDVALPDFDIADAAPPVVAPPVPRPALDLVPPAFAAHSLAPSELVRVALRLKENLTHEMLEHFSLFLYVSKADNGPWAQRLYVFRKDAGGNLAMLYNWPASTGREKIEMAPNGTRQPSFTPLGYYQLDPDRMYKNHFSGQWHQPMPYAMFFNWENQGLQTGLAIHGAAGLEVRDLGTRASAGCIRIAPDNAAMLFRLIRTEYKGLAPRFAYDRRTATMSNQGVMMHDPAGNLKMADGYKVLVFVENYGGENVVAALF
ncbi:MAG TPA: L,D-transpeptidase [Rhizomicrobium sp.]